MSFTCIFLKRSNITSKVEIQQIADKLYKIKESTFKNWAIEMAMIWVLLTLLIYKGKMTQHLQKVVSSKIDES